jgi:hypothetical protein
MAHQSYTHISAVDSAHVAPLPQEIPPFTTAYTPDLDWRQTLPAGGFVLLHQRQETGMHLANRMIFIMRIFIQSSKAASKARISFAESVNHGLSGQSLAETASRVMPGAYAKTKKRHSRRGSGGRTHRVMDE